jgi:hypothetical protein
VVLAFPPHLASVEILATWEGVAGSLVDDGRVGVEKDEADALHKPKENWQPLPQYVSLLPHQPYRLNILAILL